MNRVARCSHCGARWRVVPDQLKVSDAWLRCGGCRRIFDAIELRDPHALQRDLSNAPRNGLPLLTEPAPPPSVSRATDTAPSFMRGEKNARASTAGQRAVRTLAAALVVLLAGLVLLWQRDKVAAWSPALGDALEAACAQVACDPHGRRHLDAISIEQSELLRVDRQRFELQLTLANASRLPVELPSIELTFTDAQDDIVLQRVLSPADLRGVPQEGSAAVNARAATLAASQSIDVRVGVALTEPPEQADRITGYRVLAIYR
jgi:predicted Zn finger-like uncharacterized protein